MFSLKLFSSQKNSLIKNFFIRKSLKNRYFATNIYNEREKGFENLDVKKHDEELLARLKAAEDAKEAAEKRAKVNFSILFYIYIYI